VSYFTSATSTTIASQLTHFHYTGTKTGHCLSLVVGSVCGHYLKRMTSIILLGLYAERVHRKRLNRQLSLETKSTLDFSETEMAPRARLLIDSVLGSNSLHSLDSPKSNVRSRTMAMKGLLAPPSKSASTAKQLIQAIQKNNDKQVKYHLEHGADPNALLWINNNIPIDMVFLWKRLFGESATSIHVAIINVYHRHGRRRELERALAILKLLLVFGGDVSTKTTNMFLCSFPKATEMNPMDLAKGLKRLTLCSTMMAGGTLEAAMDAAFGILKGHYRVAADKRQHRRRHHHHQGKPNIPFNMMSEEDIDKMINFLFSKKAPEGQHSEPIQFLEDDSADEEPQ
jgi:hypothetical protein